MVRRKVLFIGLGAVVALGALGLYLSREVWPYRVELSAGVHQAQRSESCGQAKTSITIEETTEFNAGDFLLSSTGDFVHIEGRGWVRSPAPISESERMFVLGLGEDCVVVRPFADGVRVVVEADPLSVVNLATRRVRALDYAGAYLESCRMDRSRGEYRCGLDLAFGEARFDPEGNELNGVFQPLWSGGPQLLETWW